MCENGRKRRATGAKSVARTPAAVVVTLLWAAVAPSAGLQSTAETATAMSSTGGGGGGGLDAHHRFSADGYGGGTTAGTVRPVSGRAVAARPTGPHGRRARVAQTTQTTTAVDTDFTVGRSRRPPKNRVGRLPRANGGTPIDTGTIDDSYATNTAWSKVSDSQALSDALRGNKSTVKIRYVAKNFNASIPSVIYDRANDTHGFGETVHAGRQSNYYDNSNAETDDWLTEQGVLNGNLNSYTFTNNMGHVDHKATYPADINEQNLLPLTELQSRYTVSNGPHPNQHISQPPKTIHQMPNHQLPSSNIQPVNTNFLPVNTYIQPANTYVPLVSTNIQPVSTNIQPVRTNVQPVSTNVQPVSTNVQPVSAYVQPANAYVQPANMFVQPANAYVQPVNTYVQPANTYVQPTNADVSPSSTVYQPSAITSSQNQVSSSENNTGMVQRLQKLILNNSGEFDYRMIGIIALAKLVLINLKAFAFANLFLFVLFQIKLFAFIVYLKSVLILRVSKFLNIPIESFLNVFFK